MRRRTIVLTVGLFAIVLAVGLGIAFGGRGSSARKGLDQREQVSERGDTYRYAIYIPSGRSHSSGSRVPLIVVLHGCTMTAGQMAAASGFNALAERQGFAVLYPDVDAADEASGGCWKGIWDPSAEARGRGDAGAIADMTRTVIARWHIDRDRVYAIGISAGGFESAILGAEYPDLYAAIGIHSGAAYGGGQPVCLGTQNDATATSAFARAAYQAMGPRARLMPVIVVHGDHDDRIPYWCGQQALAQWLGTDDLVLQREHRGDLPSSPTKIADATVPKGQAYSVVSYLDRSGCPVAELWTVHGMGHFWSGGSADAASARFSDARGPSAAAASWAFFSQWTIRGPARRCAGLP